MEQLAHFVTKSFEYNSTRVIDIINMTNSAEDYVRGDKAAQSNCGTDNEEYDEDSIDIEITELSNNNSESIRRKSDGENQDNDSVKQRKINASDVYNLKIKPLPFVIEKISKECKKHITKNWLISDIAINKPEGKKIVFEQLFVKNNF
jgi:hypothetical protein